MEGQISDEAVWKVPSDIVEADRGWGSREVDICRCVGEHGREVVGAL